jgi:hypothetical protein
MLGGWGKDGPAYNFSTFVPQAIVINLGAWAACERCALSRWAGGGAAQ